MNREAAPVTAAAAAHPAAEQTAHRRQRTGSLTRRMIGMAALWIAALLLIGGFALDRVLSSYLEENYNNSWCSSSTR